MPKVVHFELMADNPDGILSFYSNVFGWESQKWEGPADYWLIDTGDGMGINGGVGRKHEGMPALINTIDVDSVDDYAAKIEQLGGKISVPKMPIPNVGWLAYAVDPEGNTFGIMQADSAAA